MGKNISFDIAALFLLILLLLSCVLRKMTSGTVNRIFLAIVFSTLLATVFDIWAVSLDNAGSNHITALYYAHLGYLLFHNMSPLLHVLFIISLTDTWHKICKRMMWMIWLCLPYGVVTIALMANGFTNYMFTVDNGYKRGALFFILYMATIMYIIFDIVYIIQYRKLFRIGKILTIGAVIPIGVIAMVVQMCNPDMLVEMFCGAFSIFLVSIGIQRPEDVVDSYTGLMKYSAYADDIKRTFHNNKHVNIIMFNIGNFSSIHTLMGYDCVMEIMEEIAHKLRELNRKISGHADLYYLDRGRFRLVFKDKCYDKAVEMADEIMAVLKEAFTIRGITIHLQPFIIIARCPEDIVDFESLMTFGMDFHEKLQYTGRVMYAKDIYNKNQFNIQNNIDNIISRAFENNRFEVYYQPIYSVEKNKFTSAEALLRLNDEEYGFISPEILIPAAERSGAIHRIGDFVFEEVCRFISDEEFKKLDIEYIEVNLSVAQCMHIDLADRILAAMDKYSIDRRYINLEITETAVGNTQNVLEENLNKLSKAGITFSLDDYGTGYSNIKRVIQLPLKMIKLDKSFADEQHNPKMWIVLQNTVKMLKEMNMEIVVEGIETQEMVKVFTNLKCDFIQGYFFSKPIPKADFINFIHNEHKKLGQGQE